MGVKSQFSWCQVFWILVTVDLPVTVMSPLVFMSAVHLTRAFAQKSWPPKGITMQKLGRWNNHRKAQGPHWIHSPFDPFRPLLQGHLA